MRRHRQGRTIGLKSAIAIALSFLTTTPLLQTVSALSTFAHRATSSLRLPLLVLKAAASPNVSLDNNNKNNLTNDRAAIQSQLGYLPHNFVRVSARTRTGEPLAIQTHPLDRGGAKRRRRQQTLTPFPTLYWLTNPAISKAIAEMERQGYVRRIQQALSRRECLELGAAHRAYATTRWQSLSSSEREGVALEQRVRNMLEHSGVAGTNVTMLGSTAAPPGTSGSLKCLHAHYAHYRSALEEAENALDEQGTVAIVNPVGKRIHKLLQEQFPDVIL